MFSLPIQNLVAMFLVLQPRYPSKVILQQKSAFATLVLYGHQRCSDICSALLKYETANACC